MMPDAAKGRTAPGSLARSLAWPAVAEAVLSSVPVAGHAIGAGHRTYLPLQSRLEVRGPDEAFSAMRTDDGRAVPAFISQALSGDPMTVFGDGCQTRSLCYVDDLVDGMVRLGARDVHGPVDLGGERETTVLEIARLIREMTDSSGEIVFGALPTDEPKVRRPEITRAKAELGWQPQVSIADGLARTIAGLRERDRAEVGGDGERIRG